MCTLVVKEKGTKRIDNEALYNCFINNPDGAGLAYCIDNKVIIEKGYMKYDSFIELYNDLMDYDETMPMLLHFRIATHGGVSKGNCHPFPVSNNYADMQKTKNIVKYAMAHNGIFHSMPHVKGYSDTMVFNHDVIYPLYKYMPLQYHKTFIDPIIEESYSKIAILSSNGDIIRYGEFINYDDGIYFSNNGFMPSVYCKPIAPKKGKYKDTALDDDGFYNLEKQLEEEEDYYNYLMQRDSAF